MKIIHSSDWHIGKYLDNMSRIEEQEKFVEDFVSIVEEEDGDIVIIAGDVYDSYNPSSQAEALFYKTIKSLSNKGQRCVFIIAGNHDSPEKLESICPLVEDEGIIILGYPRSRARVGRYQGFEVLEGREGFTKIRKNGEIINIISLPYPSEKRLNDVFEGVSDISIMQKNYSSKVGEFFRNLENDYKEDEINIATAHIFVVGSSISDSERRIELGGSLLVEKDDLPKTSQYTALGHIHKPQRMSKKYNAYYSGSPIQYSKNERESSKSVNVVELSPQKEAIVSTRYLKNYRPIQVFKCNGLEEAMAVVEEFGDKDIYSYFEITTDETIDLETIKKIKNGMKNVMEIRPIYVSSDDKSQKEVVEINRANIEEYFIDFYKKNNEGILPSEEVVDLFLKYISEDEIDEAD